MHMPTTSLRHDLVAGDSLTQKHRRLEVDGVHRVERGFGHIQQRLFSLNADAIDQDVESAELVHDLCDGIANRFAVAHVEAEPKRTVSSIRQLAGDRDRTLGLAAAYSYARAAGGQTLGNHCADAAIPTGDKSDFAAEIE